MDEVSNRGFSPQVRSCDLQNDGDERGNSYHTILKQITDFLGSIGNIHIATITPGFLRGNHYHLRHSEALIVLYSEKWPFHWDSGPKTKVVQRSFRGQGAVLIQIKPNSSHAVLNVGKSDLCLVAFSNELGRNTRHDATKRIVFKP
jgi:oxalate decarboxylase/phosphoglucose isomerase-like protein (cupin superfamily)